MRLRKTRGTFPSFELCHKGEAGLTGIGGGLDGGPPLRGARWRRVEFSRAATKSGESKRQNPHPPAKRQNPHPFDFAQGRLSGTSFPTFLTYPGLVSGAKFCRRSAARQGDFVQTSATGKSEALSG